MLRGELTGPMLRTFGWSDVSEDYTAVLDRIVGLVKRS